MAMVTKNCFFRVDNFFGYPPGSRAAVLHVVSSPAFFLSYRAILCKYFYQKKGVISTKRKRASGLPAFIMRAGNWDGILQKGGGRAKRNLPRKSSRAGKRTARGAAGPRGDTPPPPTAWPSARRMTVMSGSAQPGKDRSGWYATP